MYTFLMLVCQFISVCNHPVSDIGHDGRPCADMDQKIMVSFSQFRCLHGRVMVVVFQEDCFRCSYFVPNIQTYRLSLNIVNVKVSTP